MARSISLPGSSPIAVEVTAGGDLDAGTADPASAGFVTAAQSYRLYYEAGAFPLYIWVDADDDTTLLVSEPSGSWICDDDGGAVFLSPALGWDDPPAGQYDIWVGTFTGTRSPATVNISETIDGRESGLTTPPSPPPSPPPVVDPPVGAPPPAYGPVFME